MNETRYCTAFATGLGEVEGVAVDRVQDVFECFQPAMGKPYAMHAYHYSSTISSVERLRVIVTYHGRNYIQRLYSTLQHP